MLTRLLATSALALATFAPLTALAADDIPIGGIAPLTGPAANSGEALRQGMELAVKEWNEGKGDYAKAEGPHPTFKLTVEDNNSKPEVGVSAAQRMVTRNGIKLLIGDALHSHVTMALMELAPQFNLPIISAEPVSTLIADKVKSDPEKYALYWKGNYNSSAYGETVHDFVKYAIDKGLIAEGGKKLAFVIEDTDYGHSNADTITQLFEADGWTVAASEAVPAGSTDFYPQLTKLKGVAPDLTVSVFTAVNSGVSLVKQMSEQALPGRHMAIYYPTKPEFMAQVGPAGEGLVWTSLQFAPEVVPAHKAFDERVQAAYGNPATYSHAHAYCVTEIGMRAIETAGSTDPRAISEAIGATDYNCLIGRFKFDPANHTVLGGGEYLPLPVAQIQNGKNQLIWPEANATAPAVK
ncbi:ABC transporter substrate-binding protein [Paracoccus suum]|uniref:ABC transporter substrate-binding protein n=1 Tax=Paracoccus suum TaxID=2259340 RepID=A0A344PKL3_9RHOB|nr:ABC transporter substrate-binding protein [Paracoccus suum]AXC49918.1 ABC transporter substrate-binding protein [Paracoccus suum]